GNDGHARRPDLLGTHPGQARSVHGDLASGRPEDAADGQHHGRLAGTVRPEQRRDLSLGHFERDAMQDAVAAAGDLQGVDLQSGGRGAHLSASSSGTTSASVPRYARITCSSLSTSAVRPDAISLPKSMTAVVWQHAETRLMSWSTRMTRAPNWSGILWIASPRWPVSSSGSPAAGSSSSTSLGLPTTARALSTRRRSRAPNPPTLALGDAFSPTNSIAESTSGRRVARFAPECSWIIATLSKTDSCSIAISVWNVRRSPQRARRKSAILRRFSPKAVIVPPAGLTKPLITLKKVVLPAPLGPIRPQVPLSKTTEMPSIGVTPPKRTVRFSISTMCQFTAYAARIGERSTTMTPTSGETVIRKTIPR